MAGFHILERFLTVMSTIHSTLSRMHQRVGTNVNETLFDG